MEPTQTRSQRWLLFGMAGMVAFLVALAILHVVNLAWPVASSEPGAHAFGQPRHISAYALGHGDLIWKAGVFALGAGMIAFAIGLLRLLPVAKNSRAACWLLAEAGVFIVLLDVFETDATPMPTTVEGALHDIAAIASLTLQCSAMVLLSESGSRDPTWQRVVGSSPAWAAVATVLSIGWGFLDILPAPGWEFGAIMQRAVAIFLVYWMLMVGWRVRWVVQNPAGAPSSTSTS